MVASVPWCCQARVGIVTLEDVLAPVVVVPVACIWNAIRFKNNVFYLWDKKNLCWAIKKIMGDKILK